MTAAGAFTSVEAQGQPAATKFAPPQMSYSTITETIARPALEGPGRGWLYGFIFTAIATAALIGGFVWLFTVGIGIFGNNTTIVWGYPIANYVWWIGIGNAGTLISALLLITRQHWRASINRFAEAMTIFALVIAGTFPIVHLGRPVYAYWLAPYPNTMHLWPQWRSALVWDFFAILSYLLFSILFWYTGLLPDLAAFRGRARTRPSKIFYGILALGWHGSARHWQRYRIFAVTMAGMAVPLVCSVHSIVGLDFAASLEPSWQETIFPPYFVVGAMYSGFGIVVVLAALIRWGFGLHAVVTDRHFDLMAQILLMSSLVMGASYATEWFMAWYGGVAVDRSVVAFMFIGPYAPLYWAMLLFNVVLPQAFWFPAVRRSVLLICLIAILINVGMWLERILIIWMTLSHDYMPSMHRLFFPTAADWLFLFVPLGFFAFLFLVFGRLLPTVSIHEVRELKHEETSG
jgi:molybdopterin-containing oxidoreductase family membrane subunit